MADDEKKYKAVVEMARRALEKEKAKAAMDKNPVREKAYTDAILDLSRFTEASPKNLKLFAEWAELRLQYKRYANSDDRETPGALLAEIAKGQEIRKAAGNTRYESLNIAVAEYANTVSDMEKKQAAEEKALREKRLLEIKKQIEEENKKRDKGKPDEKPFDGSASALLNPSLNASLPLRKKPLHIG